ncbi:MAG: hypothetical protein IKV90_10010, partial [Clostridia bacterium]|nr:hypothetical protein [Clostridia bacterium]
YRITPALLNIDFKHMIRSNQRALQPLYLHYALYFTMRFSRLSIKTVDQSAFLEPFCKESAPLQAGLKLLIRADPAGDWQ